jgi:flagellar hook assembly protein FlgD
VSVFAAGFVSANGSDFDSSGNLYVADYQARRDVRIRVYDVQGHEVARLHDGALDAGTHRITWAGATRGGRAAAPGVYLVRADGGGESSVMRVLRIR